MEPISIMHLSHGFAMPHVLERCASQPTCYAIACDICCFWTHRTCYAFR